MANKASDTSNEPIEVLFALQDTFNITDFAGPLEVLSTALHDKNDESMCCLPLHSFTIA